jgi:hypothetical protein
MARPKPRLPRSTLEEQVLDRFADAFQRGDLDRVVALLTEDAKLTMPPEPVECHGPQAIVKFCQEQRFWGENLKMVPTRANNQPAFAYYLPDPNSSIYRANGLMVLTLRKGQVLR